MYLPIMVGVHKIYNPFSLYPINATNQIDLGWPKSPRRCNHTTDDDGRQLIAIGNLNNSDDLKM